MSRPANTGDTVEYAYYCQVLYGDFKVLESPLERNSIPTIIQNYAIS